jgi:hypothetical protein
VGRRRLECLGRLWCELGPTAKDWILCGPAVCQTVLKAGERLRGQSSGQDDDGIEDSSFMTLCSVIMEPAQMASALLSEAQQRLRTSEGTVAAPPRGNNFPWEDTSGWRSD